MAITLHVWAGGDTLNHADLNGNFSALLAGVTGALPLGGGTLTGPLILPGDPTTALQAATKGYCDAITGASLPAIGSSPLYMLRVNAGATAYELRSPAQVAADMGAAASWGRNRLHNPWLDIQSRGTGAFSSAGYTADRWRVEGTGTPALNINAATSSYGGPGYKFSHVGSLNATETIDFVQRIDQPDCEDLPGQSLTCSAYIAASTTAGTVTNQIVLSYCNAFNNYSALTQIAATAINGVSSTPGRYSVTFANLPSQAANGLVLAYRAIQNTSTGTLTYNATGFQAEPGSTLTAIERRSIAIESTICRRYYQTGQTQFAGYVGASSVPIVITIPLPGIRSGAGAMSITSDSSSGPIGTRSISSAGGNMATVTASSSGSGNWNINVNWSATAEPS